MASRQPRLGRLLGGALLAAMGTLLALGLAARVLLAPAEGEWSVRWRVGPIALDLGVPSLIRLATSPALGPWLDGRALRTRFGPVQFTWQAGTRTLALHCAPCRLPLPGLGDERVEVPELAVTVRRDFEQLAGTAQAMHGSARLWTTWRGTLAQDGLRLALDVREAPIAHWVALAAPTLPELQRAEIRGTLALQATLDLPQQRLQLQPVFSGFAVSGLGTEAWLGARSACGRPSGLTAGSWLAHAVIAAEDQRFFEHTGYDPREWLAAHALNQAQGQIARGGSTLNQQLAKLLVTGAERTPARKLRELLYAVEMEQTLGKARILALYLDNAPWGPGLCGAEAAARHYFGRPARQLAPAQAVWLAAMLHNPTLEAGHWARTGRINLPRAQWVASQVRGMGHQPQQAVVQRLARDPGWPAPTPSP